MKTKNLFTVAAVSAGLAFSAAAQGKEHEEQEISSSDVPAAVQQAAQTAAKGANIVRWEKEGTNYEAVINQNGKETGIDCDPSLLTVLVDHGFVVGAFLFPTHYVCALCRGLGSLLHCGRNIRAADVLFFMFLRLRSRAECQSSAYRCYC